jgi:type IV pilus assembly protein PilQ
LQSSLTRRGHIEVDPRTNSLIVTDLPGVGERVEKMAMDLDATTPQIEITAKLVDVDAEALRDLGIEWNVGPQESEFFTPGGEVAFHPFDDEDHVLGGEHDTPVADPANRLTYGLFKDWIFLEAQLQTLEQNRKANIISNPRITTVNNREASVVVGQQIPLIVQDFAGNAVTQLTTIGIKLNVTPHINVGNKITMDVHPEVSDLSSQATVAGGIIINTTMADTRVMVNDGETAVIGGLIRSNENDNERGVPILMDIPLVGHLFKSTTKVRQKRELLIFLTPKILGETTASTQ